MARPVTALAPTPRCCCTSRPTGRSAYGVSLARDTVVDRPRCKVGGKTIPAAQDVIFNEAFSVGGPLCTTQQVEALTGVYIDHTVVVDFNGFKDMVDAVHGVEVCIPIDVDDPEHDIQLDAGTRLVSGQEALNYVRERHVLSVNSDIGRMKRQQAFVASMVSRVTSAGTLTSPKRLYDFLDAATGSIQVDEDLDSLSKMYDLAREMRGIDLQRIKFATVPIEAYAPDPNRLQFAPGSEDLWKVIRRDEPLGTFAQGLGQGQRQRRQARRRQPVRRGPGAPGQRSLRLSQSGSGSWIPIGWSGHMSYGWSFAGSTQPTSGTATITW